jgi:hypothetical protein
MAKMAMPRNIPSEPVALHHPILDAPLLPLSLVLGSYPALQLRRERRWVAVDVLEQPRVLHTMRVRAQPALECGSLLPLSPPASLLAGISTESTNSQPASWLARKRQQAAALQSFAFTRDAVRRQW